MANQPFFGVFDIKVFNIEVFNIEVFDIKVFDIKVFKFQVFKLQERVKELEAKNRHQEALSNEKMKTLVV